MQHETPQWMIWLAIQFAEEAGTPERVPEFIDILRTLPISGRTLVSEVRRLFASALAERSKHLDAGAAAAAPPAEAQEAEE